MSVKEKILRILELALDINPPEIEDIGVKKTAVFVRWSPHCTLLEIDIHYGGWAKGKSKDEQIEVYTAPEISGHGNSIDYAIRRLEDILAEEREKCKAGDLNV